MRKITYLFLLVLFTSCASISPAILSEKEMDQIINVARTKVSTEIKDLPEKEILLINTERPLIRYYKLSGSYADYRFSWDLKSNKGIVIYGQGDILTLDGAVVELIHKTEEDKK